MHRQIQKTGGHGTVADAACRPAAGWPVRSIAPAAAPHHRLQAGSSNWQQRQHSRTQSGAATLCRASSTEQAAAPAVSQPAAAAVQAVDYFAIDKRPVVLFDGVCNMCNGGVNFMLDWDKEGVYRFAALQSTPGRQLLTRCGRAPDDISSIVLVEESRCYIKSEAVLRIALRLGMPLPLLAGLALLVPKFVGDPVYDQVANNRYSFFGKSDSCRVSDDGFADRFLGA
uniref:Thiol-disulfide oxidoreductase DCC n=1 Tax=Tetradesmus obliquus TaxID=3088 RepID=A0A383WGK0_TETOB|eukprot:jgi/Sobl393_1/1909/SZX76342.1